MSKFHHEYIYIDISSKKVQFKQDYGLDEDIDLLDISVEEKIDYIGRLQIRLFWDLNPITCENFYRIIEGKHDSKLLPGQKLSYKNTIFFNYHKGFIIQGGDIIRNDGTGGESIFGPRIGEENF